MHSFLFLALAFPVGAVWLRASGRQAPVDFSREETTPCVLNQFGQPAWPCHIETNSRDFVRKWLPVDATVLEVGARYGSVSCVIATMQHQSGKVVAVESDSAVWAALDKNLQTYGCNVKVLKGVVGTTPVTIDSITASNGGYGTRTQAAGATNVTQGKAVQAYPLAQVENTFGMHFDTLVVDCEGCFPTLLRENPALLKQVKLIIVEAHVDRPTDSEERSIAELQSMYGFKVVDQVARQRVLKRVNH